MRIGITSSSAIAKRPRSSVG